MKPQQVSSEHSQVRSHDTTCKTSALSGHFQEVLFCSKPGASRIQGACNSSAKSGSKVVPTQLIKAKHQVELRKQLSMELYLDLLYDKPTAKKNQLSAEDQHVINTS